MTKLLHSEITANTILESRKKKVANIDMQIGQQAAIQNADNRLEQARTQWQFGDWESLIKIKSEILNNHPDRAELALFVASGYLQSDKLGKAKKHIRLAKDWGCGEKMLLQILVSGVHNSLGRASAIAGFQAQAFQHFNSAIQSVSPKGDVNLLSQARINHEFTAIGLLSPLTKRSESRDKVVKYANVLIDPQDVVSQALNLLPDNPAFLIASAEIAMRDGRQDEAIRRWQQLAAIEGEFMPKTYYSRLDKAYKDQKSFPLGSAEEELLRGDGDKHEILAKIHTLITPETYLEIGVQTGKSLALAKCKAIGVDPMPQIKEKFGTNVQVVNTTSDDFFKNETTQLMTSAFDFVFIDGMHLFEYVLRDFINVERLSSQHTLVAIDDIYPGHSAQAERVRRTRAWTGDVWKLLVVLKSYRPDLKMIMLDAYPTGLLLITGLDKSNTILQDSYKEILVKYKDINVLPKNILERTDACSCKSDEFEKFLDGVNSSKYQPNLQGE